MKKELRELNATIEGITGNHCVYDELTTISLEYKIHEMVDVNSLKLYVSEDVPETLKEFREMHNISKKDLVKWLNENYPR